MMKIMMIEYKGKEVKQNAGMPGRRQIRPTI